MMKKIKDLLFYPVSSKYYKQISRQIQNANSIMATVLSAMAIVLLTVMYILSHKFPEIKQIKNTYLVYVMISAFNLIISLTIAKKRQSITKLSIYLSYVLYYMFGIMIGTVFDPMDKTVTFIALLVFMPIPFIVPPINVIVITAIHIAIFIILCFHTKEGTILQADIIDSIIFGILGCTSGAIVNNMKVKNFILEYKLRELSFTDELTQIKNRNAYEFEKNSISNSCNNSLACIYIDVNELHEINNTKGHEYGDKMLKFIAKTIRNEFDRKYIYRLGGDEFIVFIPDREQKEITEKINKIIFKFDKNNYHISFGLEISSIEKLNFKKLVKTAEKKMFKNKKQYYKNINRQIRNKQF